MSKKRGFLILTIVLSFLSWLSLLLLEVSNRGPGNSISEDLIWIAIFTFMVGVIPIWLIYSIIKFIVAGFKSKE